MNSTRIEWTGKTWNPVTGCNKISAGCKHCYAETMAKRLKAMGNPRYANGFELTLHEDKVVGPMEWKKGQIVFVNSMSDLFHKDVPVTFIQKVFQTMRATPQHIYQVLTKRSERLLELDKELSWAPNIWMGVSVENQQVVNRIDDLRACSAYVKFLSCEPLLGPLADLRLNGIHWVIVGGESGPHARPMEKEWLEDIHQQCQHAEVAFFFKQWGGRNKKASGRLLHGRTWDEMPHLN